MSWPLSRPRRLRTCQRLRSSRISWGRPRSGSRRRSRSHPWPPALARTWPRGRPTGVLGPTRSLWMFLELFGN
eukprot:9404706-Pyramimonas_sp.AAC.1